MLKPKLASESKKYCSIQNNLYQCAFGHWNCLLTCRYVGRKSHCFVYDISVSAGAAKWRKKWDHYPCHLLVSHENKRSADFFFMAKFKSADNLVATMSLIKKLLKAEMPISCKMMSKRFARLRWQKKCAGPKWLKLCCTFDRTLVFVVEINNRMLTFFYQCPIPSFRCPSPLTRAGEMWYKKI